MKDQYAPSTTYVMAWMNLYTQGMWFLLLVFVPFALIFEEQPERLGVSSWEFYTLQAEVPNSKHLHVNVFRRILNQNYCAQDS